MGMTKLDKGLWLTSRAAIATLFIPNFQNQLFVPFLSIGIENMLDPWQIWLAESGRSDAFPYGPIMFIFLGTLAFFAKVLNMQIGHFGLETSIQIMISIAAMAIEYTILRLTWPQSNKVYSLRILYLFAPLPIYITFIYGQIDIFPALLLLLAANYMQKNHWALGGFLLGASISTKFSIALSLPFILVYFLHGGAKVHEARKFLSSFLPMIALMFLPAIWSSSYVTMVLETPEVGRSLDFFLQLGQQYLYLLPVGYLVFLFIFWSLPRVTTGILGCFIAITLISVASLQTGSAGWYYWGLPLLLPLLSTSRTRLITLFMIWQLLVTSFYAYKTGQIHLRFTEGIQWTPSSTISYLLFTFMIVSGFALLTRLIVEMNTHYDPYNLRTRPLSIAIAGDSGAGKDTLTNAISSFIGSEQVSILLGDDYHLAERGDLLWQRMTPLNTAANDLLTWNQDLLKTLNRKKAFARHYDHSNGHFTPLRVIEPSDFVLTNGLHSLLLPTTTEMDLRVFLSMDENLRVKLKLVRDSEKRGHMVKLNLKKEIGPRRRDAAKFINPQKDLADLVIHTNCESLNVSRLKYSIYSRNRILIAELYRLFSAAAPDFVVLEIGEGGFDVLVLDPSGFDSVALKLVLGRSVDKVNHLIVEPNFEILDGTIMGLICLIVASRNRMLRYA